MRRSCVVKGKRRRRAGKIKRGCRAKVKSRSRRAPEKTQIDSMQAAVADISSRAVPSIGAAKPTPVLVDQAMHCLPKVAELAREQPELTDLTVDDAETVILPFCSSLDYVTIED